MTISLILRDPSSGELGIAISSSSPAVAARCVHLSDGIGGVSTQNLTDPRLGPELLEMLANGATADEAIEAVVSGSDQKSINYRQLLVLDNNGNGAAFSGKKCLGIYGSSIRDNAVSAGNMLANMDVIHDFVDAAISAHGKLEERLYAGLQAAIAAGGEKAPLHSAGLSVVSDVGWRITDLRVDWTSDDPVHELGEILDNWLPQRDDYIQRAIAPENSPSF